MAEALHRHGDAPTVDEVVTITRELYPREWQGSLGSLLPVVAAAELRETGKEVRFLREAAREQGLPPTASIAGIRAIFARYTDPPSLIGPAHVDSRTGHPAFRPAAAV